MSNKISFNDTTDYADVLRVTKQMYSDVVSRGTKCCQSPNLKEALDCTNIFISAADYNGGVGDVERYQHAVKGAYLTLYPFSLDADYNYQPL